MSDANVALVRRLYDSGMAPDVVDEIVADDLVWDITPGAPFGGVYHGWPQVTADFFGRLLPHLTSLKATPENFYGAEGTDHVFVTGYYAATELREPIAVADVERNEPTVWPTAPSGSCRTV
ncbi:hypothetical protein E4J66_13105 [Actinomyces viscosus]|uniref:SnoaL-like domain-containing protein n=1 Tax=Actinomyces viscosus TaxID=1656 RepID=A0A448PKX2_ACTVI|nr:hypothetical protein [Actinomyces viscosus]TFH51144.1 hypothetical protein E4J66_13105 [Actinomyces viscosus]VEI15985.1 Uncharacterised protein [Actinomyces viscosus]